MQARLATNPHGSHGDTNRHIAKAATAARTFDTMLRALERRQAKPLSVPVGRPAARVWPPVDLSANWQDLKRRGDMGEDEPVQGSIGSTGDMTDDEIVRAWIRTGRHRLQDETEGLDIANTEGILPGGGMIVPEDPTPPRIAYMERRMMLRYCREKEESRRNGTDQKIVFRPIRTGNLIL